MTASIEKASLAHLGRVRGKSSARMIWRKERGLRKTAVRLKEKAALLKEQETYLLAVGGVTSDQLNMAPVSVHDGVYGFMDMVGSVKLSRQLAPKDYFFILNACHEIAAENAGRFTCRVDNIIGDAVFFQNVSVFDPYLEKIPGPVERLMLMTLLLASVLSEIHQLFKGGHPIDRERRVYSLVKGLGRDLGFRAGMNQGRAMVGPLGSKKRKIVTAVGEAVDLASRLESSGSLDHIHTTAYLAGLLQEAWISTETRTLYDLAWTRTGLESWAQKSGFYFFDFFRALFKINGPMVLEINESSYKEFSMSNTRLIRCLSDGGPSICSGI
ncbi:MAG: adenylate/guanylate cyclase domain-containing protein [Desulfobacter sp.]|nr:adenylate/guanylate cyclase domain-containing protein [Desulfobacter sp.]